MGEAVKMSGVATFLNAGLWLVPAALLVVLPMPLAAPEDAAPTIVSESVLVPYYETVIAPTVSYAYSVTGDIDHGVAEILPGNVFEESLVRTEAIATSQDELNVLKFEVAWEPESGPREDSISWHNGDAFYVDIQGNDLLVKRLDVSTSTVTVWQPTDKFYLPSPYGPISSYYSPGVVDSSGMYYFLISNSDYNDGELDLIFRLDPNAGSLAKWNEKRLVGVGDRIFTDAPGNLYFAEPVGRTPWGYLQGDRLDVPKSMPVVTLSSSTGSDGPGLEYATVGVYVESRGAHTYGTLTAPDSTYQLRDGRLTELLSGNERAIDSNRLEGVLGEYAATVQDRYGTATVAITLTEEQKVVRKSSPRTAEEPQTVWVLANKLDPNTNQITTFYGADPDLHLTLLEVDASGAMYFGVFHGTSDHYATGIAKFDPVSGALTTWPNIQCHHSDSVDVFDIAVYDNKIYCTASRNTMAELDVSSNTLRRWANPEQNVNSSSIDVDSTGTVFFSDGYSLARFVPSTGALATFDVEDIRRVHVDSAGTLHATVQANSPGPSGVYAVTIGSDVLDAVPVQSVIQDAAPERAQEHAIPEPNAETASAPNDIICGPGTVRDAYGTCQLADRGGGCLIATAAHGTELAEPVQRLREAREAVLSAGPGAGFLGAFNHVYYSFSPHVADMERQNPALREAVRMALAPMLATLQIMAFADTEAQVVSLGILAVAANVGMYGSPLILAVWTKRRFARWAALRVR